MKKVISLITALFFLAPLLRAQEWRDLNVLEINREKPRNGSVPFATIKEALNSERWESSFYECLNGTWKFITLTGPIKGL